MRFTLTCSLSVHGKGSFYGDQSYDYDDYGRHLIVISFAEGSACGWRSAMIDGYLRLFIRAVMALLIQFEMPENAFPGENAFLRG